MALQILEPGNDITMDDETTMIDDDNEYDNTDSIPFDYVDNDDNDDEIMLNVPEVSEIRVEIDETPKDKLINYLMQYEQYVELLEHKAKKKTRQQSISIQQLHNRMFKKLLDAEADQETELENAKIKIAELERQLKSKNMEVEQKEAERRNSISSYTTDMYKKLLDTENEYKTQMDKLTKDLKETQDELQIERLKNAEYQSNLQNEYQTGIDNMQKQMMKRVLDASDNADIKIDELKQEVKELKKELAMERDKGVVMERERRGSITTLHNSMMAKLLDAEAENEDLKDKYQKNINELNNEIKLLKLESQVRNDHRNDNDSDSDISDLDNNNGNNNGNNEQRNSDLNDLFNESDLDNDDNINDMTNEEKDDMINELKNQIISLKTELNIERKNAKIIEKQRQDSIHNLHNNMFQKLLDAEFEYEEEIEGLQKEIEQLREQIKFYESNDANTNNNNNNNNNISTNIPNGGTTPDGGETIPDINNNNNSNNSAINEYKNKYEEAVVEINDLKLKINTLQDNLENTENERRNSIKYLSNKMFERILEAEVEYDEKESTIHELKQQNEELKTAALTEERKRKNSVTQVSQEMFQKLLVLQNDKKQMQDNYETKISELENKLALAELKNETNDRQVINDVEITHWKSKVTRLTKEVQNLERVRRNSITDLKEKMWQKLLEAEEESAELISKYKRENDKLKLEMNQLKKDIQFLTISKLNMIQECNTQLNVLRKSVTIYENKKHKRTWFGLG